MIRWQEEHFYPGSRDLPGEGLILNLNPPKYEPVLSLHRPDAIDRMQIQL